MGRIIAIDYGKKRTGIAVSDPLHLIANGLCTVLSDDLMAFLKKYVSGEAVDLFVVGFPLKMNHQPSENLKNVNVFVEKLNEELPDIPVKYVDERFTSSLAKQAIIDAGLKKKKRQDKALVDEVSAVIILQSYLESKYPTVK